MYPSPTHFFYSLRKRLDSSSVWVLYYTMKLFFFLICTYHTHKKSYKCLWMWMKIEKYSNFPQCTVSLHYKHGVAYVSAIHTILIREDRYATYPEFYRKFMSLRLRAYLSSETCKNPSWIFLIKLLIYFLWRPKTFWHTDDLFLIGISIVRRHQLKLSLNWKYVGEEKALDFKSQDYCLYVWKYKLKR